MNNDHIVLYMKKNRMQMFTKGNPLKENILLTSKANIKITVYGILCKTKPLSTNYNSIPIKIVVFKIAIYTGD